jgi:GxxExxY protein
MSQDADLTEKIIGAAYTVLNTLKPGLDEKLYERALVIELAKLGLQADAQKQFRFTTAASISARSSPISSWRIG